MNELNEIRLKIRDLRHKMYLAIDQKGCLVNPEVVSISQLLDDALNQYNVVISSLKI